MGLPRRTLVAAALMATGLTAHAGQDDVRTASGLPTDRLARAAAASNIRYGSAPFAYPPVMAPDYVRLIAQQCAMLAPVLNWRLISPAPVDFIAGTDGGAVVIARANALALTGFHLIWHEALPDWFATLTPAVAARAIEAHIAGMGAAYADATWSVNVANEILDPNGGREDGLRQGALTARLGPAYLDVAFRAARSAFPRSLLLLNEYGLEQGADPMRRKRHALLRCVDRMQADGTPLDGIGLQSHLSLEQGFDAAGFAAFLAAIAARGLRIVATELDVLDIGAPSAVGPRDDAVAVLYARYLETLLAEPATCGVVTWGLSDRYTWLTPRSDPRFARPDGLPVRPLPFDAVLRPKPAHMAMLAAFRAAPPRP